MEDLVSTATRNAIKLAKRRSSPKVTRDDLLMGIFQAIARFGIVKIDFLTIDLEEFGEISEEAFQGQTDKTIRQKVAYSPASTAVFERAAQIARNDGSLKVELVHLLVAFAYEDNGLMARLKQKYGFSSMEWRSALSGWRPRSLDKDRPSPGIDLETKSQILLNQRLFFTPDEAAEFLGIHTQTIRGYIRTGKLSALRLAGERALRIRRDDLLALLEPYKPEET